MQTLGTKRLRTTAYHPIANGMIERFHRQLKAALKCRQQPNQWTEALPMILLGIRSACKEDLGCTTAELVYGASLRLPGEFFTPAPDNHLSATPECVNRLKKAMSDLRAPPVRAQHRTTHVHTELSTCTHVFVRRDAVKPPLQPPYDGPFKVLDRKDKYFTIEMRGRPDTVSMDRLKPAFLEAGPTTYQQLSATPPPNKPSNSADSPTPPVNVPEAPPVRTTRYGRRVHWPDRLNL